MRRALLFIALVAAPATAAAQSLDGQASQQIQIVGEAPGACVMQAMRVTSASNATFRAMTERAGVIDFAQLVDPETSLAQPASVSLSLPVICNGAHVISLRPVRGALVQERGAPAAEGFSNRLVYGYSADWAGKRAAATSEAPLQIRADNAAAGEVSVSVNVPEGGDPLVSGAYADSIVVELQPAN